MNVRVALLSLIAFAPALAHAGVRFDFTTEVTGYSYAGRMSIEGTSSRVDITSGSHPVFNPNFSIITRRAGKDLLVLDHKQRTYFMRSGDAIGGHLAAARGLGKARALAPRIRRTRDAATSRYALAVEYRIKMEVEGETLDGVVQMEAEIDVAPDIDQRALPWGLQFAAKTGFENVDRAIERRLPSNLPLRQMVSATRRIADGPAVTETITTTATNLVKESIDDGEFQAPLGYRYQEPLFQFGNSSSAGILPAVAPASSRQDAGVTAGRRPALQASESQPHGQCDAADDHHGERDSYSDITPQLH